MKLVKVTKNKIDFFIVLIFWLWSWRESNPRPNRGQ